MAMRTITDTREARVPDERRQRKIPGWLWFVALWCGGVAAAVSLGFVFKLFSNVTLYAVTLQASTSGATPFSAVRSLMRTAPLVKQHRCVTSRRAIRAAYSATPAPYGFKKRFDLLVYHSGQTRMSDWSAADVAGATRRRKGWPIAHWVAASGRMKKLRRRSIHDRHNNRCRTNRQGPHAETP
jgi:hypothetical protein